MSPIWLTPCLLIEQSAYSLLFKPIDGETWICNLLGRVYPLRSAPYFPGGIDQGPKPGPLLIFCEKVAFHRGNKAALRADGQLYQRNKQVLSAFRDAVSICEGSTRNSVSIQAVHLGSR